MAKAIIDKLAELEYNELFTLGVIERDADLTKVLRDENIRQPFSMLYKLSKDGLLSADQKDIIRQLFDYVILTKKELIGKYLNVSNSIEEPVIEEVIESVDKTSDDEAIEIGAKPIKVQVSSEYGEFGKPIDFKTTEDKVDEEEESDLKLPRRYGKEKILKDIEAQGGKATPLQNAMLRVNDLKNIYVNLSARGIKDMCGGSKLLSDVDCREITSAIKIVERKLEEILKRKK